MHHPLAGDEDRHQSALSDLSAVGSLGLGVPSPLSSDDSEGQFEWSSESSATPALPCPPPHPPRLRRDQPRHGRFPRLLAALRSIMTSWKSEKSAAGTGNGYLPVPNRSDSGLLQDIALPEFQEKPRAGRSRCSYVAMFIAGVL